MHNNHTTTRIQCFPNKLFGVVFKILVYTSDLSFVARESPLNKSKKERKKEGKKKKKRKRKKRKKEARLSREDLPGTRKQFAISAPAKEIYEVICIGMTPFRPFTPKVVFIALPGRREVIISQY